MREKNITAIASLILIIVLSLSTVRINHENMEAPRERRRIDVMTSTPNSVEMSSNSMHQEAVIRGSPKTDDSIPIRSYPTRIQMKNKALGASPPPIRAEPNVLNVSGGGFISVWDTTRVSNGSTTLDTVRLPLVESGQYNFTVDWGDGNSSYISSSNYSLAVHVYSTQGVYTLNITGKIEGFAFNNTGDRLKLIEIAQFGPLELGNTGAYFYGAENLVLTATDAPDLGRTTTLELAFAGARSLGNSGSMASWNTSSIINMSSMFRDARDFNISIASWDTSSVIDMDNMFRNAYGFDQDLGVWNISSVVTMRYFLSNVSMSIDNYNSILINWSNQSVNPSVRFDAGYTRYDYRALSAREILTTTYGWTITDGGVLPFVKDRPVLTSYELGSTSNELNWTALGGGAEFYSVLYNGTAWNGLINQTWLSGDKTVVNVDGLTVGTYNFTIIFSEVSGDWIRDTVILSVEDTTSPGIIIHSPGNYTNSSDVRVTYTIVEYSGYSSRIFLDGAENTSALNSGFVWGTLGEGPHNLTMIVTDQVGYTTRVVYEFIVDLVVPVVTVLSDILNLTYEDQTTGHHVNLTATDLYLHNYTVYRNETLVQSNTIVNGSLLTVSIDGLTAAFLYIYRVSFYDLAGNSASINFSFRVIDTVKPMFLSLSPDEELFSYEYGTTGNVIYFAADERNPDYYMVSVDGGANSSRMPWIGGVYYTYNVDGLGLGAHNATVILVDTSGNYVIYTQYFTVVDTTAPTMSSGDSQYTFYQEEVNRDIIWTFSDPHPSSYSIYINSSLYKNGMWTTGQEIRFNVDELVLGVYSIVILVSDSEGNTASFESIVRITLDPVSPEITGGGIQSVEQGLNLTISWVGGDKYPDVYIIYRNGTAMDSGTWTNGTISWTVNSAMMEYGRYNYTLQIFDKSGNSVKSSYEIVLVDTTAPSLDKYTIPSQVEYGEPTTFEYKVFDFNPSTYGVYVNGSLVDSGLWEDGVLSLNLSILYLGNVTIELSVVDDFGNLSSYNSTVWVSDTTITYLEVEEVTSPLDLGESVSVTVSAWDFYPANYTLLINGDFVEQGVWNWTQYSVNLSTDEIGTYVYTMVFVDKFGNTAFIEFSTLVEDMTAPVIETPDDQTLVYQLDQPVNLTFSLYDPKPSNYTVYRNGEIVEVGQWVTINRTIVMWIDPALLEVGEYNITVQATDKSGNTSEGNVILRIVYVEENPPDIIEAPRDIMMHMGDTALINWTVFDEYLGNYSVFINNEMVFEIVLNSTQYVDISYEFLPEAQGLYSLYIIVFDRWGFYTKSSTVTVEVLDSIENLSPRHSKLVDTVVSKGGKITIVWDVRDPEPESYEIFINGSSTGEVSWDGKGIRLVVDDKFLPGQYVIEFRATNKGGYTAVDSMLLTVFEIVKPPELRTEIVPLMSSWVLFVWMVLVAWVSTGKRRKRV